MKKVLYFLNSGARGGVEEHVLCLLRWLDREAFDPVLVCPAELLKLLEPELKAYRVRSYPVCIRKWTDFKDIRVYWRILKQEKPDVVHSHLFFATLYAAPLSKLAGVPAVVETAHIREAWRKGIKKAFFIDRWAYGYVDRIIAVSEAVKRFLTGSKGVAEGKITVIRNGVDLERFSAAYTDQPVVGLDKIKKGLGFRNKGNTNQRVKIGVIGRLAPQKGHKYFFDAVRLLRDKADKAEFLIAGEGSLRKELENLCQAYGIGHQVKFLGFRPDIKDIMASLDILVLPSLFEGLPLVALEASAMGKAVIVTNVDGSPEVVLNEETGLVVPPEDSKALKEAMEVLIFDDDLRKKFGERARKRMEDHFDLKKQVTETENIYRRVLERNTPCPVCS
ncbi:MAG TPA: glycosyltransferase family 4 protein [Candidatus Omnitrophota bacterium]|nr:glycosyltransferase family 4 protein [Candidatus Omnitrophota bacterium]